MIELEINGRFYRLGEHTLMRMREKYIGEEEIVQTIAEGEQTHHRNEIQFSLVFQDEQDKPYQLIVVVLKRTNMIKTAYIESMT